jgi:transposase
MERASSSEDLHKRVALAQSEFCMKKYQLHPKTEDILSRFPALCKRLEGAERTPEIPGVPRVLCLGADLEKAGACLAVQCGLGEPVSLGTLTRETILRLLPVLRARGWRCVLGMEACGFGWRFQRQLREAGAEVLTFATEALTGRRKTNTRDAAALARLVGDRTVHGNTTTSRIVREPSPEEQQRRFLSRHRAQLIALRGKIEAQGRGLMLDFGQLDFPDCWWGKKMWPRLVAQLTAAGEDWLREALEPQRAMAMALHAQILELDARLAVVAAQTLTVALPHGLGQLTALTACLEVMDWQRFSNRKKVGSYIGCAPSENSTGGDGQLLGQIDRQGNRRLRSLLTEAIWRLIRWEPGWHGFAKWGAVIRESHGSSVRKKKAVIACVRLLFIDLWRLFTGRATLADLGFRGAPATAAIEPAAATC